MTKPVSAKSSNPNHERAAVLVSGGIVSMALLEYSSRLYVSILPIYIQSGFRWEESELFNFKKFQRGLRVEGNNIEPVEVMQLPLRDIFQTHWSVTGVRVPSEKDLYADILLPGRDWLMLAKAAVFCAYQDIRYLGVGYLKNHLTHSTYGSLATEVESSVRSSVGKEIELFMPFAERNREEVLFDMKDMRVDYSFSCLSPRGYHHCGDCYKCQERKISFFKTGIPDKTYYSKTLAALVA